MLGKERYQEDDGVSFMSCWSLEMSREFYIRMGCKWLEFYDSLRMEVGVKVRQFRVSVMVSSRQDKYPKNLYGVTEGDFD